MPPAALSRPRSGAAVAALRLRAAAWEIELTELPGQISLWLWGCELRLVDDAVGLRLMLSGPERRLVDTLRDCAAARLRSGAAGWRGRIWNGSPPMPACISAC